MPTQRLFFALWPDEPMRERLRAATRELAPPDARVVAADAVHLTLLFIGSVDALRRACLGQVADGIKASAFTFTLDQAGFWRKPQILWLGCSAQPAPLLVLVQGLTVGAEQCGVTTETRPYQAHVTLARKVRTGPLAVLPIEGNRVKSPILHIFDSCNTGDLTLFPLTCCCAAPPLCSHKTARCSRRRHEQIVYAQHGHELTG